MTKVKNTAHNLCLRETPQLVEVQTGTVALDPSMVKSQKSKQQTILKLSYTSSGPIYQRCSTILQGHVLNHVHSRITLSHTESENTPNVSLLHT